MVSDSSLLGLCEKLADELVLELSTVPWEGNIKRGLIHKSEPRKIPGGWAIGVGSLGILHRRPAPSGTISDFLEWYRAAKAAEMAERAKSAAAAKEIKARKHIEKRKALRSYFYATFEDLRITRAREAGKLTKEMIAREQRLWREFLETERKLDAMLSQEGYKRIQLRMERLIEARQERRRRKRS